MRCAPSKVVTAAAVTAALAAASYGAFRYLRGRRGGESRALVPLATGRQVVATIGTGRNALIEQDETLLLPAPEHRSATSASWIWVGLVLVVLVLAGGWWWMEHERHERSEVAMATGGVIERAVPIMLANGCAGCHTISGVPSAQGKVGPPLDSGLSQKVYLAGSLPNNLQNMISWLRFSRQMDPNTAMPSTGISEQEARDVAAYLYAIR